MELDPGRTLTVQVRGPDGKPLDGLRVHGQFARSFHQIDHPFYKGWSQDPLASEFTVYGLEPGRRDELLPRVVQSVGDVEGVGGVRGPEGFAGHQPGVRGQDGEGGGLGLVQAVQVRLRR